MLGACRPGRVHLRKAWSARARGCALSVARTCVPGHSVLTAPAPHDGTEKAAPYQSILKAAALLPRLILTPNADDVGSRKCLAQEGGTRGVGCAGRSGPQERCECWAPGVSEGGTLGSWCSGGKSQEVRSELGKALGRSAWVWT